MMMIMSGEPVRDTDNDDGDDDVRGAGERY